MSKLQNGAPAKNGQSGVAYRIVAAMVAIACVAAFFLPYTLFAYHPTGMVWAEEKLYDVFKLIPDAPFKFLGFIPMFTSPKGVLGVAGGLITYILVATLVIAFLCSFVSLIMGKKATKLLSFAVVAFAWGAALYMIAVVSISCYLPMKIVFDQSSIILAAVGTLFYFVLMLVTLGRKTAILNGVRFLLTLGFTVCLLLALCYNFDLVSELISHGKIYKVALVIAAALTLLNIVFASLRALKKKAFAFDFINSVAELIIAGALIAISVTSPVKDSHLLLLSCIAAGIAFVLFILTFIGVKTSQKKASMAAAQESKQAAVAPATEEPSAEVSQPVEIAPAVAQAPVEEDYFAGKQIDSFIETLDVAERNQFASLYLLKHKDVMPEVPVYQIGGDNQYFFEMVFIMLGDYRDEIPDGVLSKMYDYMCANYPQTEVPEV